MKHVYNQKCLLLLCVTQKALQLSFYFFLFFPSRQFFWTDYQKLFSQRFIKSYQESVRSTSGLIPWTHYSVKVVSQVVVYDACGTLHGLCTVTCFHSIQKSTTNSQKLGNKLSSGWQKIQRSIEHNWIFLFPTICTVYEK